MQGQLKIEVGLKCFEEIDSIHASDLKKVGRKFKKAAKKGEATLREFLASFFEKEKESVAQGLKEKFSLSDDDCRLVMDNIPMAESITKAMKDNCDKKTFFESVVSLKEFLGTGFWTYEKFVIHFIDDLVDSLKQ